MDEINVAKKGLRVSSTDDFCKSLLWDKATFSKMIGTTPRMLERRREDKKPLGFELSESALELARLSTFGIKYFESVERWNNWLNTPNMQFNRMKPCSVLNTVRGRELVRIIVLKLENGFSC
jgi:putative toxin-antitoxin system antitoxin component (TIGR02293 family)